MPPVSTQRPTDEDGLAQLAAIFGVQAGSAEFEKILEALATAALREYTLSLSGTRAPSTMRDVRELRLSLLYQHLPDGAPTDAQVTQLMQLTPSAARSLIAGTRARHRMQLTTRMTERAAEAIKAATKYDERTVRVTLPGSLAAFVMDLVAETQEKPLDRDPERSQTYLLKKGTATELGKVLGFKISDIPGFG